MKNRKIGFFPVITCIVFISFSFCFCQTESIPQNITGMSFPEVSPESVGISGNKLKNVSAEINNWLESERIVGAELHIIKSGKTVLHEVFGWRDKERGRPWKKNTICRIRSMTKPVVGTALLILVNEGKISVDDKVSKYLPYYDNEKCREISVKQLLHHTGGFQQPGYPGGADNYISLQNLIGTIGKTGPAYSPGERFSYSDAGSSTLAYLVTKITSAPVEDFIQSNIFNKLGMNSSFCNLREGDARRERVSSTYRGSTGNWNKYWDFLSPQQVSYFRGSGGVYSTTTDYARFLTFWMERCIINHENILNADLVKEAFTPSSQSRSAGFLYGYQWIIYEETENGLPVFGHSGSDGTYALADPDNDLMILYFTQSRGNDTLRSIKDLVYNAVQ